MRPEEPSSAHLLVNRFEEKDFADLDLNQVRAQTPLRELGETPLDRHRSCLQEL